MVRSMFAGVAGLKAHQARMDMIGNNIANVNTWGYKSGKMSFKDAMYQTTSSASGGTASAGGYGGTNANQVGYGVVTGSINYDFSMGGMAPSSRGLDCMIDGSGFFLVGPMVENGSVALDDEDAIKKSGLYLSRVGIFQVDDNGYLVDDGGNYVYGFTNDGDWTSTDPTFNTMSLAPIKIPTESDLAGVKDDNATDNAEAAKKALAEARALLEEYKTELQNVRNAYMEVDAAYKAACKGFNVLMPGDTVGHESKTLTEIQDKCTALKTTMDDAYKAWTAASKDTAKTDAEIAEAKKTYDDARINYEKGNFELIKAQAKLRAPKALDTAEHDTPSMDAIWTTYEDALKNYNRLYAASATDPTTQAVGSDGTLMVDDTGAPIDNATAYENAKAPLEEAQKALQALQKTLSAIEEGSPESKLKSAQQSVDAAEAKVTAAEKKVKEAEQLVETANSAITSTQVGDAGASSDKIANLNNYSIAKDGTIMGTSADDGISVVFGKIALIGVQNTSGLIKENGYYYQLSDNCGSTSIYEGGSTAGSILGNYLEQAKVDLADELTDMITTQRGFQANTKIITVTDQMLEELVNMKR